MNKINKNLMDLLKSYSEDPLNVLNATLTSLNCFLGAMSVEHKKNESSEKTTINIDVELDDNDYDECVNELIDAYTTTAYVSKPNDFTLVIECKGHDALILKWNNDKQKFVIEYEEESDCKCKDSCAKSCEDDTYDKSGCEYAGVKFEVKDNSECYDETSTETDHDIETEKACKADKIPSLAMDIHDKIMDDLAEGRYDDFYYFNVDEAIENMKNIIDSEHYTPIFCSGMCDAIGIEVDMAFLNENFDPTSDDVETILKEQSQLEWFMTRCKDELGFSNVCIDVDKCDDENNIETIIFKMFF